MLTTLKRLVLPFLLASAVRANAQQLSLVDRVEGVSRIWMEAEYNFAFFDQVPDLDWNEEYRRTIDRVASIEDDRLYYRELERFVATLRDGHSNVFMPPAMQEAAGVSPLKVAPIDGEPVVYRVASQLADRVPIGSIITEINEMPTAAHVEAHVRPFISASSPQQLQSMALGDRLIAGRASETFTVRIRTPAGETRDVQFDLVPRNEPIEFVPAERESGPYELTMLEDGIVYLRIDTFGDGPGLEAALGGQVGEFLAARGIVIDLRRNGGGNTAVGAFIAGLLTDRPLPGAAWRTREHRASDLAWSVFAKEGTQEHRYAIERGGWYEAPAAVWPANPDLSTKAPVVVLTDWRTASAAEDFLIIIDDLQQVTTVGRATFGSSGQPLYFPLPGGGSARICAKRDTYPDGRDFVGTGMIPDIEVPLTLDELTNKKDHTLERALKVLRAEIGAP